MKRGVLGLLVVIVLAVGILPSLYAAEPIKLKSANYLPITHPMSTLGGWFCDEVKKRTNGRVEITYYPGGTLLSPVKMYDGVVTGITDMGMSHISYTRGRFPVTEVFDNPHGFPHGWVASQVVNDFYAKFQPKEWNEVHPLYINTSGPLLLLTVSKAIKTLDDLKGVKIRATGQMSEVIKALGGIPVPLEMPDVYESMRRQVIEGTTNDLSTLKFWKFAEVNKFVTACWQLGTGYTFYFIMNKNKWNALLPDIQKIFTEVAEETRQKQALLWNTMDIEGADVFKKAGGQTLFLSDAEAARWIKAVAPVFGAYKKAMAGKGFKEADVDQWNGFIQERIKHWSSEAKKTKIPSPF